MKLKELQTKLLSPSSLKLMDAGQGPRSPIVVDLHEREARVFPRSELFDSKGGSLLLPETRRLSAVDLREVDAGVELRARGLIGYLPLTAGIILNLRPKFPVGNLWKMLEAADATYDEVLPVLRSYESADVSAPHMLLAKAFCHYLRGIITTGITCGYPRRMYEGHFKPKVNFGKTLARYLSQGDNVNVVSDAFMFSPNLHINGLLKTACLTFLGIIPDDKRWINERSAILDALNALHSVTPVPMQLGDQALVASLPIWMREAYLGALTVYAVQQGFSKIGFPYQAFGSKLPSFLFALDSVFENFIRNTFRILLRVHAIAVGDGNSSKFNCPLFLDNKRFPVKPDIIFRRGKSVLGLGEVKYKPKIVEADRYQLISHVTAIGAPFGIWISPAIDKAAGLEYVGSIRTGAKFFHYRIDIGGDLDVCGTTMVSEVSALLPYELSAA